MSITISKLCCLYFKFVQSAISSSQKIRLKKLTHKFIALVPALRVHELDHLLAQVTRYDLFVAILEHFFGHSGISAAEIQDFVVS